MLNQNFVVVGTIIGALGGLGYLLEVVQGKVKPNRVSFSLWSIYPMIAFIAEIKQGVGLVSLMTLSQSILPFLIVMASLFNKKAEWKITKFDLFCGFLSLIGLALWLLTKVGNVAIVFSILADGLACFPTIRKAFYYPETEIAWPWLATAIGVVLTLLTIKKWTFANYGFLIYLLLVNLVIFSLVQFTLRKRIQSKE